MSSSLDYKFHQGRDCAFLPPQHPVQALPSPYAMFNNYFKLIIT